MQDITIFSKKKKSQEEILADFLIASIRSGLCFLVEGYRFKNKEKVPSFISIFDKKKNNDSFMNWGIDTVLEQIPYGTDYPIKYIDNNQIFETTDYHRIGVTDTSCNDEIVFHFCYEYLKINQEDIFIPDNIGLTWNTMKERYENGYTDNWFCQVYK